MKKMLLFGLVFLFSGILSVPVKAEVTCYTAAEVKIPDFWLDHFYYAQCTDWEGTGSKLFAENPDYIDFNGGSTVEFPVRVSQDGEYVVTLSYGIGYADATGATMTINVNGEFATQLTLYKLIADPPATIDFSVELYADYDNVIQLKQVKDWPIILGIQLSSNISGTISVDENSFTIVPSSGAISIENLSGENQIDIYTINGKIINSEKVTSNSFNYKLNEGLYIVKVNGEARKVVVK